LEEGVEAVFGILVGGVGVEAGREEGEDEGGEGMANIVEDDEGVGDDEIGEGFFRWQTVWDVGFEEVDGFVGEVADEAAAEAGGAWGSGEAVLMEVGAEDGEGVAVVGNALFVHTLAEDDGVPEEGESGSGGEAEDGESAPAFTAFDAFEEEDGFVVGKEAGEDGDGGIEVGENFGSDGDDVGVAGEGAEGVAPGESVQLHETPLAICFFI
jgi:hypothetical protein